MANEVDVGGSGNLMTPGHFREARRKANKMRSNAEGLCKDSRGDTKEKNKAASKK